MVAVSPASLPKAKPVANTCGTDCTVEPAHKPKINKIMVIAKISLTVKSMPRLKMLGIFLLLLIIMISKIAIISELMG